MKYLILNAIKKLLEQDIDIIQNATKEECINHRLALYLEEEFKDKNISYGNIDIEYNKYKEEEKKMTNGRVIRPDIIVHERRGGKRNNLIVIEAKKGYPSINDRQKVLDLVDSSKYNYTLGVLVSYLPDKRYIKVKFYNGSDCWDEQKISKKNS